MDNTPKSKMERTALTDILLGKQEIDEVGEPTFYYDESSNQLTINQGYYYTIGLSKDFPKVVESFRHSKRNDSLPAAMGLALEEMVQRNIQFTDAIAEQFANSDYITKALAKSFSNNNFKLKQEGIEFAPGDFKMGIGDKLLGHIDIKYTTKGPSNPNRYLNMIHINNDNSAKPLNEIAKIVEGYTFHGDKKHIDNMVLLYMYPDDGY